MMSSLQQHPDGGTGRTNTRFARLAEIHSRIKRSLGFRPSVNLEVETTMSLLGNPRRWELIRYLVANDDGTGAPLSDLAEAIAAMENEDVDAIEELTRQQVKRVYVSLYQTHVPELEDAGVVTFDRDAGLVIPGAEADGLDLLMDDIVAGHEVPT